MNFHLEPYKVAVQHPDVSGFEMLDMLMVRDRLERQLHELTAQERSELQVADEQLLAHADQVFTELSRITSFRYERQQRQPGPERWWWYLDVLAHLPHPLHVSPQPAA